jgi:hypothetical protein
VEGENGLLQSTLRRHGGLACGGGGQNERNAKPEFYSGPRQPFDITNCSTADCAMWCQFMVCSETARRKRLIRLADLGLVLRESANGTKKDSQK